MNKTVSIFTKLSSFYEKEVLKDNISNVQRFFNILDATIDYIQLSDNYISIPYEELELGVRIIVVESFSPQNDIVIRRNFLARNKKIMEINSQNLPQNSGKVFETELAELILGKRDNEKPSLKQILSHNIRFTDIRVNNTLKMINSYTMLPEYETLFLYMFGLEIPDRSELMKKLKSETQFRDRVTQEKLKKRLSHFNNTYFSKVSKELYDKLFRIETDGKAPGFETKVDKE